LTSEKILFASLVAGEEAQRDSVLLAASIRDFAGKFSETPIKFLVPEGETVNSKIERRLNDLEVELTRIKFPSDIAAFPLASIPYAAGQTEKEALYEAKTLVWLSSETIVIHEPSAFRLPENKFLGVRPVHHLLVGSRWDDPLNRFWSTVYNICGVQQDSIFPMTTVIDGIKIRPYFNSGILVTKPEQEIFRNWSKSFLAAYKLPELVNLYNNDSRYRIFIHQAILTGVVLAKYNEDGVEELPSSYNYPLHLYSKDTTPEKPQRIEDLTTFRFESTFREPNWRTNAPIGGKLKEWVSLQLKEIST
jgi:hypothetical protein